MLTTHYFLLPSPREEQKASHTSLRTEASESDSSEVFGCLTSSNHKFQTSTKRATPKRPHATKANTSPHADRTGRQQRPSMFRQSTKKSQTAVVEEDQQKYKTELCKNFQETGKCKFGKSCMFAHGKDEMQPKTHVGLQYKTKPCDKFTRQGFCPYGQRCCYIHEISQSDILEIFCDKVLHALELSSELDIRKIICDQQSK